VYLQAAETTHQTEISYRLQRQLTRQKSRLSETEPPPPPEKKKPIQPQEVKEAVETGNVSLTDQ